MNGVCNLQARYLNVVLAAICLQALLLLILGYNSCWTYLHTQVRSLQSLEQEQWVSDSLRDSLIPASVALAVQLTVSTDYGLLSTGVRDSPLLCKEGCGSTRKHPLLSRMAPHGTNTKRSATMQELACCSWGSRRWKLLWL